MDKFVFYLQLKGEAKVGRFVMNFMNFMYELAAKVYELY